MPAVHSNSIHFHKIQTNVTLHDDDATDDTVSARWSLEDHQNTCKSGYWITTFLYTSEKSIFKKAFGPKGDFFVLEGFYRPTGGYFENEFLSLHVKKYLKKHW